VGLAQNRAGPVLLWCDLRRDVVGAVLNFTPLDPIKALFWSAVINGVTAVPIMVMVMLLASSRQVMGGSRCRGPSTPWDGSPPS